MPFPDVGLSQLNFIRMIQIICGINSEKSTVEMET